jgi:hypothetical protein
MSEEKGARPEVNPKKHHYVPRHVLRRFCDPPQTGVLWTYDKEAKQIYPGSPVCQASENHFYSFESSKGFDNKTIEVDFLSKIDDAGSTAIESVLRREQLSEDRVIDFMRFAACQMIRVKTHFQRLDALLSPILQESAERLAKYDAEFKTGLADRLRERGGGEAEIADFMSSIERGEFKLTANRGYLVSIFLSTLDSVTKSFCQMDWRFATREDGAEAFVTSDNPLVLDDIGEGEAKPLGIMNPTIEVSMPLSPTTVALARWGESAGYGYGPLDSDYVAAINQRTINRALRFVYASKKSDELLATVVSAQGKQARMHLEKRKEGDATIFATTYLPD